MKIHAVLSWFDESPTWLATAVAGIGRFCDTVVAVDGAYQLFPAGRPKSHPQQVESIVHTAEAMGLGCLVYQPQTIWYGNEVEKRNKSLELAASVAEEGDWLCVFDADYHVLLCNPEAIRAELEATEHDVATYTLLDGKDFQSTEALERYAAQTYIDHEWAMHTRDLYRWNPTLRVGPAHWAYSVERGGEREWLRHQFDNSVDALDLRANLVFYHRTQDRSEQRRKSAEQYYATRNEMGIEVAA